jgi:uncharacterized damage-inducible protein DinB
MAKNDSNWKDTLVHLFALASRLEGEGQYNLAKLTRAAADSLSRQAAYRLEIPTDKTDLSAKIKEIANALTNLEVNPNLVIALKKSADIMADGRLPLIDDAPHAYVCRTCGHLVLKQPVENCPICEARASSFQRFPPVYWLDVFEPLDALERLRQTPKEVEKLLEGLSDSLLNQQAKDGGWSIRNTLSHLRDAQGVFNFRVDLFLKEEHPTLEAKAVFAWAMQEENRPPSTFEIFSAYKTSRSDTISKLENLPMINWWHTGQHQEFGAVTLKQQVSYFAAHEVTHLPQIEGLRRQLMRR